MIVRNLCMFPGRVISPFEDLSNSSDLSALGVFYRGTPHKPLYKQTEEGNQREEVAAMDGEMMTHVMANFLRRLENCIQ